MNLIVKSISIISLLVFIYFADSAHWFDYLYHGRIVGYNNDISQVRALVALTWLIAFTLRNELSDPPKGKE